MEKWKCMNTDCDGKCVVEIEQFYPIGCVGFPITGTAIWEIVEEPTTATLPKLTAEVFDRKDCPEWANWAAVDSCGDAYCYAEKPQAKSERWFNSVSHGFFYIGKFDATDWRNSLVERPEKALPEWCKVGEWVWYPEDMAGGRYLKITEIRGGGVYAKEKEDYDPDYLCFDLVRKYSKQARLRPYTADEMRALVGKVVSCSTNAYMCINFRAGDNATVDYGPYRHTAKNLLEYGATLGGKPCGVLEHYENGEWVE